jgi:hypothetical protein
MTLPPKVSTRGGGTVGITAATWNQLIDYLKSTRVVPNIHVRPLVTSQGTILATTIKTPKFSASPKPWQIIELMGEGEPDAQGKYSNYSFRVYPGTINNILPANTFDGDGLVKFTISANGMKYLFLDVATDGTKVTTATLKVESTLPTDAPPVGDGIAPAKIVIPLGIIQNNSPIALRSSALTASPAVAGSKPKAPTSPNDEPFTRIWMWKVEGK